MYAQGHFQSYVGRKVDLQRTVYLTHIIHLDHGIAAFTKVREQTQTNTDAFPYNKPASASFTLRHKQQQVYYHHTHVHLHIFIERPTPHSQTLVASYTH